MSVKYLVVGDPHCTVEELDDCENLLKLVHKTAKEQTVDCIFFMGDLFHNHAIVHLSVLGFWQKWFTKLSKEFKVISLVGNHDFGLTDKDNHALVSFKTIPNVRIIEGLEDIGNGCFAMSYIGSKKIGSVADRLFGLPKNSVFFCHETFDGAQYENGFYAPDGIELDLVGSRCIISGHIHTPSEIFGNNGKCAIYVGAPRWRTISDANIKRSITVFEIQNGLLLKSTKFSTGENCSEIIKVNLPKEMDKYIEIRDNPQKYNKDRITFEIHGNKSETEDISEDVAFCNLKNATVKTFIESKAEEIRVKESAGIKASYDSFCKEYLKSKGFSENELDDLIKERTSWLI